MFEASVDQETKCSEFSITQDGLDEVSETFILSLSFDNEEMHSEPVEVSITACTAGGIIIHYFKERLGIGRWWLNFKGSKYQGSTTNRTLVRWPNLRGSEYQGSTTLYKPYTMRSIVL